MKSKYPRIFAIAQTKNLFVQDAYRINNGCVDWWINVSRNLQDWEVKKYENLLQLLASPGCLEPGKSGKFSVKSYYSQLTRTDLVQLQNFPMRQIWKTKAPPRIAFFAWEACRECILTTDKLKATGMFIPNRCYLCKKAEESSIAVVSCGS